MMPRSISAVMSTKWHVAEMRKRRRTARTKYLRRQSGRRGSNGTLHVAVARLPLLCILLGSSRLHCRNCSLTTALRYLLRHSSSSLATAMKKRSLWAWMLLYSSVAARGTSLNLGVRLVKAQNLSEIPTRPTQNLRGTRDRRKHQNAMGHGDRKTGVALRAEEFVKSTDRSHQRRYKLRLAIASQV